MVDVIETFHSNGRIKERYDVNAEGQKHGIYQEWTATGHITRCIEYVDGLVHGYHYYWAPNSSSPTIFKSNKGIRASMLIHADGVIVYKDPCFDLPIDYTGGFCWIKAGYKCDISFEEGLMHGVGMEYYSNGNTYSRGEYNQGERVGIWEYWHENGSIMSRIEYAKDKGCQVMKSWYQNGQLNTHSYQQELDGVGLVMWRHIWNEKGVLESQGMTNHGICPSSIDPSCFYVTTTPALKISYLTKCGLFRQKVRIEINMSLVDAHSMECSMLLANITDQLNNQGKKFVIAYT